ncbi:MAG: lytic transglycosylase domain-containing protein [Candidatus Caldatribacteriaceae bacterium]
MDLSGLRGALARITEIERRFVKMGDGGVSPRAPKQQGKTDVSPKSFEFLVEEYARKYDMDPKLVKKLIQIESGFDPQALSPKGAMGLMQLMPETCQDLGIKDPFNVEENLEGGIRYLKNLMCQFQDVRLALAAYNAGPGRVREYGGVPPFPETERFIKKILGG